MELPVLVVDDVLHGLPGKLAVQPAAEVDHAGEVVADAGHSNVDSLGYADNATEHMLDALED